MPAETNTGEATDVVQAWVPSATRNDCLALFGEFAAAVRVVLFAEPTHNIWFSTRIRYEAPVIEEWAVERLEANPNAQRHAGKRDEELIEPGRRYAEAHRW